jgi:hypothetical protein
MENTTATTTEGTMAASVTFIVRTFDINEYKASHWHAPRGRGRWLFRNQDGKILEASGTYTEAKKQLPSGKYVVCP